MNIDANFLVGFQYGFAAGSIFIGIVALVIVAVFVWPRKTKRELGS